MAANKEVKHEKKGVVKAAKKFSDKQTGRVYEAGDDITHLGEERHEELKQRGFIKA